MMSSFIWICSVCSPVPQYLMSNRLDKPFLMFEDISFVICLVVLYGLSKNTSSDILQLWFNKMKYSIMYHV